MTNNKFNTIKTPLTYEEKKQRCIDNMEFTFEKIDIEKFCAQEIFYETIEMKCPKCGFSEIIEYEIVEEIMHMHNQEYPKLSCAHCSHTKGGVIIPIDIYNRKHK